MEYVSLAPPPCSSPLSPLLICLPIVKLCLQLIGFVRESKKSDHVDTLLDILSNSRAAPGSDDQDDILDVTRIGVREGLTPGVKVSDRSGGSCGFLIVFVVPLDLHYGVQKPIVGSQTSPRILAHS